VIVHDDEHAIIGLPYFDAYRHYRRQRRVTHDSALLASRVLFPIRTNRVVPYRVRMDEPSERNNSRPTCAVFSSKKGRRTPYAAATGQQTPHDDQQRPVGSDGEIDTDVGGRLSDTKARLNRWPSNGVRKNVDSADRFRLFRSKKTTRDSLRLSVPTVSSL